MKQFFSEGVGSVEIIEQVFTEDFNTMIIRILIALVLSGLIGFEREVKRHFAGFRTHILVGVGACLMMLLSLFGFEAFIVTYDNVRFDPARIPSYVISGIGFLGAGTIIVYGGTIRGLTTAASIWAVAGIGLVVGAGMYAAAVFTTMVILISLIFLNNFENLFIHKKRKSTEVVDIEIIGLSNLKVEVIAKSFEKRDIIINNIKITKAEDDQKQIFVKVEEISEAERIAVFEEISDMNAVKTISDVK
ncbi:MgtC/SapB family protein [Virgibacillus kimchii]